METFVVSSVPDVEGEDLKRNEQQQAPPPTLEFLS